MEQVLTDLIPTMTSNTTPKGKITSSGGVDGSCYEYYAFDKINDIYRSYISKQGTSFPAHLEYTFDSPQNVYFCRVILFDNSVYNQTDVKDRAHIHIKHFGDDNYYEISTFDYLFTEFANILVSTHNVESIRFVFDIPTNTYENWNRIGISEIEVYGRN